MDKKEIKEIFQKAKLSVFYWAEETSKWIHMYDDIPSDDEERYYMMEKARKDLDKFISLGNVLPGEMSHRYARKTSGNLFWFVENSSGDYDRLGRVISQILMAEIFLNQELEE